MADPDREPDLRLTKKRNEGSSLPSEQYFGGREPDDPNAEAARARLYARHYGLPDPTAAPRTSRPLTDKDRIAAVKRGPGARSQSPRVAPLSSDTIAQFAPMPDGGGFQFGSDTSSFAGFGNSAPAFGQGRGGEMDRVELTSSGTSNNGNATPNWGNGNGFGQQQQQPAVDGNTNGPSKGLFSSFGQQQQQQPTSGSSFGGGSFGGSFGPQSGSAFGNNANANNNKNNNTFGQQKSFTSQQQSTNTMDGWSAFKSGSPAAQANGTQNSGASVFSSMQKQNTSNLNFDQTFNTQQAQQDANDDDMDIGVSPQKPQQQSTMFGNNNSNAQSTFGNSNLFTQGNNNGASSSFGQRTSTFGSNNNDPNTFTSTNGAPSSVGNNNDGSNRTNQSDMPPRNSGGLFDRVTSSNGTDQPDPPPRNSGSPFDRISYPDKTSSQNPPQTPAPQTPAQQPFGGFAPSTAPAKSAFAGSSNLFGASATPTQPATTVKAASFQQPSLFSQASQKEQYPSTPSTSLFAPKQNSGLQQSVTPAQKPQEAPTSSLFSASTPQATQSAAPPPAAPSSSLFTPANKTSANEIQKLDAPQPASLFTPSQPRTQAAATPKPAAPSSTPFAPASAQKPEGERPTSLFASSQTMLQAAPSAVSELLPPQSAGVTLSVIPQAQADKLQRLNEGFLKHLSKASPAADFAESFQFYMSRRQQITGGTGSSKSSKEPTQSTKATAVAAPASNLFSCAQEQAKSTPVAAKPQATAPKTGLFAFGANTPSRAPDKSMAPPSGAFSFTPAVPATEPAKKRTQDTMNDVQAQATSPTKKRRKSAETDELPKLSAGASNTAKLFEAALDKPTTFGGFAPSKDASSQPKPSEVTPAAQNSTFGASSGGFAPSKTTASHANASEATPQVQSSTFGPSSGGFKFSAPSNLIASASFQPTLGNSKPASTPSFLSSFGQDAKKQEEDAREKARDEDFDSEEDDPEEWNKKYEEEQARKKAQISAVAAGGFQPSTITSAPAFSGFKPSAGTLASTPSADFKPSSTAPPSVGFKPNSASSTTPSFLSAFGQNAKKEEAEARKRARDEDFDSEEDDPEEWDKKYEEEQERKKAKIEAAAKGGSRFPMVANPSDTAAAAKRAVSNKNGPFEEDDDEENGNSDADGSQDGGDDKDNSPEFRDDESEKQKIDPHEHDEFKVANNDEGNSSNDITAATSKAGDHACGGQQSTNTKSLFQPSTTFTPLKTNSGNGADGAATPYAKSIFGQSVSSNVFGGGANFSPGQPTPAAGSPSGQNAFGKSAFGQSSFGQSTSGQSQGGFNQSLFGKSTASNLFSGTPSGSSQTWQKGSPIKFGGDTPGGDMTPGRTTLFGASTNSNFYNMPNPKNAPGHWPPGPGMPNNQANAETNKDDGDDEEANNEPQVENMTALLPSEGEESDVLHHVEKAKAFKFEFKGDAKTKTWNEKALGPVWLLKNKTSGKTRVLLKVPPFGKSGMNFNLLTSADMYKPAGKRVMASFIDHIHEKEAKAPSQWYIQFGKEADAQEMGRLMKEHVGQQ